MFFLKYIFNCWAINLSVISTPNITAAIYVQSERAYDFELDMSSGRFNEFGTNGGWCEGI